MKSLYIAFYTALTGITPLMAVTYHEPGNQEVLIRTDKLPIDTDTMKWLSNQLIIIAERKNPGTAEQIRANAQLIALAKLLNSGNTEANRLNDLLKEGKRYDTTSTDQVTQAISQVWSLVRFLSSKEAGQEANLLSDCIKDAVIVIDPKHPELEKFTPSSKRWENTVENLDKFKETPKPVIAENTGDNPRVTDIAVDPIEEQKDKTETPKDDQKIASNLKWNLLKASISAPVQEYARIDNTNVHRSNIDSVQIEIDTEKANPKKQLEIEVSPNIIYNGNLGKSEQAIKSVLANYWGEVPNAKIRLKVKNILNNKGQPYLASNILLVLDTSLTENKFNPNIFSLSTIDEAGNFTKDYGFWKTLRLVAGSQTNKRILAPKSSEDAFKQLIALEKPEFFVKNEIILVESLKEARTYSGEITDPEAKEATELFKEFQEIAESRSIGALSANKSVRERLEKILQIMPNHLSAKMILLQGSGSRPIKMDSKYLAFELDDITSSVPYHFKQLEKNLKASGKNIDSTSSRMEKELEQIKRYVDSDDDEMFQAAENLVTNFKLLSKAISRIKYINNPKYSYHVRLANNTLAEIKTNYETLDRGIAKLTGRDRNDLNKK